MHAWRLVVIVIALFIIHGCRVLHLASEHWKKPHGSCCCFGSAHLQAFAHVTEAKVLGQALQAALWPLCYSPLPAAI